MRQPTEDHTKLEARQEEDGEQEKDPEPEIIERAPSRGGPAEGQSNLERREWKGAFSKAPKPRFSLGRVG